MNNKLEECLELLWSRSRFTSYFYQSVQFMEMNGIPTIALTVLSSRLTLFYNNEFTDKTDTDHLTGLMVHEMLHVIMNHDHRAYTDEDIFLQNLAQDMTVNSYIAEHRYTFFSRKGRNERDLPELLLPPGLPAVPKEYLHEKDTKPADTAWEDLYAWLKTQSKDRISEFKGKIEKDDTQGLNSGAADPAFQRLSEAFESIPIVPVEMEKNDAITSYADLKAVVFEDEGEPIPTGIHLLRNHDLKDKIEGKKKQLISLAEKDTICREERAFEELRGVIKEAREVDITPWKHMIKSIVDFTSQSNEWKYTYSRFNRRYFTEGIYSPGRIFKEIENITVVVDVSGSMVMNPGEIEAAFGVLEQLQSKYMLNLLCIDEELFIPEKKDDSFRPSKKGLKPYIYKKGDWKHIKTGISGTTFFAPLFNSYMKNHREMLIVITDGYIYDIDKLKKYIPTLWLISGSRKEPFIPPFGKVVQITAKDKNKS